MNDEECLAVGMLEMWECRKGLKRQKTLQHTIITIVSRCCTYKLQQLTN